MVQAPHIFGIAAGDFGLADDLALVLANRFVLAYETAGEYAASVYAGTARHYARPLALCFAAGHGLIPIFAKCALLRCPEQLASAIAPQEALKPEAVEDIRRAMAQLA